MNARRRPERGKRKRRDSTVPDASGEGSKLEGSERRELRRLEDARAARGETGSELPGGHEEGIVPGNDESGNSDWLLAHIALERGIAHVDGRALELLLTIDDHLSIVLEAIHGICRSWRRQGKCCQAEARGEERDEGRSGKGKEQLG